MARSLRDRGNNSGGMINGAVVASCAKRVIALMDDRDIIGEDIKQVYAEAKGAGVPAKHLREFVKKHRMDQETLQAWRDFQEQLEVALGPYMDTPLGAAAAAREERVAEVKAAKRRGRPPRSSTAGALQLQDPDASRPDPEAAIEAELDRIIDFPGPAA